MREVGEPAPMARSTAFAEGLETLDDARECRGLDTDLGEDDTRRKSFKVPFVFNRTVCGVSRASGPAGFTSFTLLDLDVCIYMCSVTPSGSRKKAGGRGERRSTLDFFAPRVEEEVVGISGTSAGADARRDKETAKGKFFQDILGGML